MDTKSIITKYVNVLYEAFINEDIERCLSKARHQFDMINSKGEDYAINYFNMLSEKNIALAIHVFRFYTKCTNLSITEIKETLVYQTGNQLQTLNECEFVNLYQLKQKAIVAQKANSAIDDTLSSINKIQVDGLFKLADICFASLVLNDHELVNSVFDLVGNKLKDDISCDKYVDRFSEQLNNTNEIDRGRFAVNFLSQVYGVIKPINNEFSLKIVLHFKMISTIVGKESIKELTDLCKRVIDDSEYRFLRHVIGCFSSVLFDGLGIDERSLTQKILNEYPSKITSKELFYGLKTVEDYNTRNGNVDERLDYWWGIVEDAFEANCMGNEEEYKLLKTYYALRRIRNNPQSFLQISKLDDTCKKEIDYELIDTEEHRATVALILFCPENVEEFLKWLGNWNYYKFDENEKKFLWAAQDDNGKNYISILAKHYSSDSMVYIYMNSFLRSVVPINILLKSLYDVSERQRDDHLMVKNLFSPYRMCAKLYMYDDKLLYESVSFSERGMKVHNLSDTVRYKLREYYEKNKNDDLVAYIHFYIAAAVVKDDFKPDIHLEYKEFLNQDVKGLNDEIFSKCINLLDELSTKQEIHNKDLVEINNLPRFSAPPGKNSILGMSIIRVLNNLTSNRERVKVLKQLKVNPYVYTRTKALIFGDLKENDLLKAFMRRVVKENGFFEDKLYIYLNTALRLNVYFDNFIRKSEVLNGRFFLNKIFLSQGLQCFGRVFRIYKNGDEKTVIIRPSNIMASNRVKYALYTNSDISVNDRISFIIRYYDDDRSEFVIGEYEIRGRNSTFYFDAIAKARTTLNLDEFDKKNLQKKMDIESIKRNSFRMAIYEAEAIGLRKDNYNELNAFLTLIKIGSPWRFSTDRLPCYFPNRNKCSFVDSMIIDIIREYDTSFVVDLYFNTSLKSLITLDEMCGLLYNEGKLDKKTINLISKYPLKTYVYLDHLKGYNIHFTRDLDELLVDKAYTDGVYMAYDYDIRNNRVKLKLYERTD